MLAERSCTTTAAFIEPTEWSALLVRCSLIVATNTLGASRNHVRVRPDSMSQVSGRVKTISPRVGDLPATL